ncbi:MAG: aldo/keto reductase [Pseudomonadales bacterium]
MIYKNIAQTGIQVSQIGLGTVKIGRDKGVKYPSHFSIPNDSAVCDLLALASELQINLLDTAPAYGDSEARLGKLLGAQRKNWVICSKAGESFDNCSGESSFDFSERALTLSVERSLQRLNTDYIDILMIHSDGRDMEIIERDGALQTLDKLKRQGKIRASGMSTKTIAGGRAALEQSDCAMVTYNLAQREELPLLEYATALDKGIFIKKAFASGHLQSAATTDPISASFELIFAQPSVSSAVIGTINPQHLRDNVAKYLKACQTLTLK